MHTPVAAGRREGRPGAGRAAPGADWAGGALAWAAR